MCPHPLHARHPQIPGHPTPGACSTASHPRLPGSPSPKRVHIPQRTRDQGTPNGRHPQQGTATWRQVTGSSLPPEVAARPGRTGTVALTQEWHLAHAGGLSGSAGRGGAAVAARSPEEPGSRAHTGSLHSTHPTLVGDPRARTTAPLPAPGGEQHRPHAGPHAPAQPGEATHGLGRQWVGAFGPWSPGARAEAGVGGTWQAGTRQAGAGRYPLWVSSVPAGLVPASVICGTCPHVTRPGQPGFCRSPPTMFRMRTSCPGGAA